MFTCQAFICDFCLGGGADRRGGLSCRLVDKNYGFKLGLCGEF